MSANRNRNPSVPKIIYHGTLSDQPPHEYDQPTFHAGTRQAASDRLDDEISHGVDWDEVPIGVASVHAYEVSPNTPKSRKIWDDPMSYDTPVPEHKSNRVYPYLNSREDINNLSYVVPTGFVGSHVKHLGVQFQQVIGGKDAENAVFGAIRGMLGIPSTKS